MRYLTHIVSIQKGLYWAWLCDNAAPRQTIVNISWASGDLALILLVHPDAQLGEVLLFVVSCPKP